MLLVRKIFLGLGFDGELNEKVLFLLLFSYSD
ncbi:hypothetical protein cce_4689 [Crocosphaera subtropica ATCC 51142]|uniref:Uncharacterized protein n=1 Tax=Crocosphaera subtropica (strain ATCC 51142 / BH68) TaxID=43989 RepID=B1WWA9_CROS5|nr:hypothetical protein cce_4689 [Crocosphaera subtropica ATCC 51142]